MIGQLVLPVFVYWPVLSCRRYFVLTGFFSSPCCRSFLDSHPKLQFFGLLLTPASWSDLFTDGKVKDNPDLKVCTHSSHFNMKLV